jgi:nucleoside-diphosphate-sugar epimerase
MQRCVFITGGTGYVGRPLITLLLQRGHEVRALVRHGSERNLPAGCQPVVGDALESSSYAGQIKPADTFVQLVGVSHPNPSKAAEFRNVDLVSGRGAIEAAAAAACSISSTSAWPSPRL